ncbi:MAG: tyrosine-type recombinase/integrase [Lachnospiraceae bacterium]|nr:tyrosine-type recombinase/integrase [Lachnospiraceae bacterium]
MADSYKQETQNRYHEKLDSLLKGLPDFCRTYFIGRENRLSEVTAVSYAYNLQMFFTYLHDNNGYFGSREIRAYRLEDLEKLNSGDIEEFLHWLRYHRDSEGRECHNSEMTIQHYISAISALYKYFVKRGHLPSNPVDAIDRAKRVKKKVIRLEGDEKKELREVVESGAGLTKRQTAFHDKNRERDMAIYEVFLTTGMRISELVGINVTDVDLKAHTIGITRKGSNYQLIYISDRCTEILMDYMMVRERYGPPMNEPALFLSNRGSRISVRTVEMMTKKYVTAALPQKTDRITPHKLRSTYATDMLRRTVDLELVSELLGHSNIATTQIYARYDDKKHEDVRNVIDGDKPVS